MATQVIKGMPRKVVVGRAVITGSLIVGGCHWKETIPMPLQMYIKAKEAMKEGILR